MAAAVHDHRGVRPAQDVEEGERRAEVGERHRSRPLCNYYIEERAHWKTWLGTRKDRQLLLAADQPPDDDRRPVRHVPARHRGPGHAAPVDPPAGPPRRTSGPVSPLTPWPPGSTRCVVRTACALAPDRAPSPCLLPQGRTRGRSAPAGRTAASWSRRPASAWWSRPAGPSKPPLSRPQGSRPQAGARSHPRRPATARPAMCPPPHIQPPDTQRTPCRARGGVA